MEKLLLVEDSEELRAELSMGLADYFEVISFSNFQELKQELNTQGYEFAVCLCDFLMIDCSGIEVLNFLHSKNKKIVRFLMSGTMSEDEKEFHKSSYDYFIDLNQVEDIDKLYAKLNSHKEVDNSKNDAVLSLEEGS